MNPLTEQQKRILKGVIVIALALLAVIGVLVATSNKDESTPQEETRSVNMDISDADTEQLEGRKFEAYKNKPSGDYWDSLLEDDEEDDMSLSSAESDKGGSAIDKRRGVMSMDDFKDDETTQDSPATQSQPAPQRTSSGSSRTAPRQQSSQSSSAIASSASSPAASQPHSSPIDNIGDDGFPESIPLPKAKSSDGVVESLDDGNIGGFDDEVNLINDELKPYKCMFTRNEKLTSGSRISIRAMEDVHVRGITIPKNSRLSAIVTISNRVMISVTSIEMNGKIYTCNFEGYDTDGMRGIYCSGLSDMQQRAIQEGLSTGTSVASSRLGNIARSAVNLGTELVRSSSGKVSVSVPSGYEFYIMHNNR